MKTKTYGFEKAAQKLGKQISGTVEERLLMKRYTSFRIGGICALMVFPKNAEDLATTIDYCENAGLPWRIIGRGSNLLVLDGELDEVVINLQEGLKKIEQIGENRVRAEASVNLNRLVKVCQDLGLSGLEWAAGVPGSVGGAIRMNAGAEKKDIAASLKRVEFFRHPRGVFAKDRDELKMGYREFDLADKTVILAGEFELTPDNPVAIRKRLRAFLKRRRQTQPVSLPSAGSVFKNPHGDFAGRLIEEVGLKGFRLGDAQVSEMHANFIVNRGRAKAKQVLELIAVIKDKVKKEKGVKLELEIEVVGKSDD